MLDKEKKKSHSQNFFDEEAKEQNKKERTKKRPVIRYAVLGLAVCLLVFFVVKNYKNLAPDRVGEWLGETFASMGAGKGYPYAINSNAVLQFEKMNQDIAVLTDTSVLVLNSSAKEIVNRQHDFSSPVMDAMGNRLLLYDLGGKRLRVENRKNILFETTMQQNIITADISEDGSFAVATQSSTSACELKVYSRNFHEILTWYSSSDHIINVAMAPDGKSVAVSVAGAQGGEMKSTIYIIDFTKEAPVAQFDYTATLFLTLDYTSEHAVIAAGDHMLSVIDKAGNKLNDIPYEASSLKRSVANTQPGAAVLYSMYDSDNLNDVLMLDENGSVCYRTEIRQDVRWIDHSGNRVYALCGNEICWFDEKGTAQTPVEIGSDCSKILAFGNHVYVLGMNEIRHYNLLDGTPKQ